MTRHPLQHSAALCQSTGHEKREGGPNQGFGETVRLFVPRSLERSELGLRSIRATQEKRYN